MSARHPRMGLGWVMKCLKKISVDNASQINKNKVQLFCSVANKGFFLLELLFSGESPFLLRVFLG